MKHEIFNIHGYLEKIIEDRDQIVEISFKGIVFSLNRDEFSISVSFPSEYVFSQAKHTFFAKIKKGKIYSVREGRTFSLGPSRLMFDLIRKAFWDVKQIGIYVNRQGVIKIEISPKKPQGLVFKFQTLSDLYCKEEETWFCENCGAQTDLMYCEECRELVRAKMQLENQQKTQMLEIKAKMLEVKEKRLSDSIKYFNKFNGTCASCKIRILQEKFEEKHEQGWYVRKLSMFSPNRKIIERYVPLCHKCDSVENTVEKIVSGKFHSQVSVYVYNKAGVPIERFSFHSSKRSVERKIPCPKPYCRPALFFSGGEIELEINLELGKTIGQTKPCTRCKESFYWECKFDVRNWVMSV